MLYRNELMCSFIQKVVLLLQGLPDGLMESYSAALKLANKRKNRYKSIYPCLSYFFLQYLFNIFLFKNVITLSSCVILI